MRYDGADSTLGGLRSSFRAMSDKSSDHYDLIVIGSGPGGEKGAAQAAYFGKRVALVEKEAVFGGAAANTGTLPSKTLRETSLFLSGFKHRQLSGIQLHQAKDVTVGTFLAHERSIKEAERGRIEANLVRHQIDIYQGTAGFVDAHTVRVKGDGEERTLSAEVFLIATGSSPRLLPNIPYEDGRVYNSDTILNLARLPKAMCVVGGGVIGCEYACIFNELGARVLLVESRERLLGFLDEEISANLQERMEGNGIHVALEDQLEMVGAEPDCIKIQMRSGSCHEADTLMLSAGRTSNIAELNLEGIGVETGKRGLLLVNQRYQTNIDHIYAVGDVIGFPALASTSMEQGRVAMVHAFDLGYKPALAAVLPYGIYTIPECSMAGKSESELRDEGTPYVVGRARYRDNARGQIIGDRHGMLKLLFDLSDGQNMRLVGVHVIGEQATELVHIGLSALLMQGTEEIFINTCYNYPTLSEMYKYAAYDALGNRAKLRAGAAVGETA